ncbi:hypothetical protein CJ030_MR1G027481 [Morella rubra]|uniref:Pentatricopeptide repeat-containing protein n=1 Tax=Morella rubra TaxID=262757 RepID=A0A6A1WPW2_9ROSI|nr:hypothetical protein CJ030_MR1G027481 [Morella rubra]
METEIFVEVLEDFSANKKRKSETSQSTCPRHHKRMKTNPSAKTAREANGTQSRKPKPDKLKEKANLHSSMQDFGGVQGISTTKECSKSTICRSIQTVTGDEKVRALEKTSGFKADNPYFMVVMQPTYVSFGSLLLCRPLIEGNVLPNDATLVTVLSACARLGAIDLGKWVHVYEESSGYKGNLYVGNALIDMYAKCGIIESAVDVFKSMAMKDLITWNTVINALAMHGHGSDALTLFCEMKNAGETPDGITFIGILCACTHMGLVKDGFSYFQSMVDVYSIVPQTEHYGCMVDLLARAGHLKQVLEFVRKMPVEADAVIWAALLGACRIYKNIELAELALEWLIELEPKNPANFVMLSNIYGDLGRWKDVARLKVAMRDTGLRKLPGCSLVEVNDSVVEFYSLDERHPEKEDLWSLERFDKTVEIIWVCARPDGT